MANETIGTVPCAHCGETSDVRRYKSGTRKLYYHCPNCGQIRPALETGQEWIRARATWLDDAPAAAEPPKADNSPPADQEPAQKSDRKSIFEGIL